MVRGHHSFLSSFSALLCVLLHLCHQWLDSFPFDKHDLTTLPPPALVVFFAFLLVSCYSFSQLLLMLGLEVGEPRGELTFLLARKGLGLWVRLLGMRQTGRRNWSV